MQTALLFFALAVSQTKPVIHVDVKMCDGSSLRAAVLDEHLEVKTKYGKLTIPFGDVRLIEFGCHTPSDIQEQVSLNIQKLGAADYRVRELASQFLLRNGAWSRGKLQVAVDSDDKEVSLRASEVLAKISKTVPQSRLNAASSDVIHAVKFKAAGHIVGSKLRLRSSFAGVIDLSLCKAISLYVRTVIKEIVVLDAAAYGSANSQWYNTKVVADSGMRLSVTASGRVDLFPQEPGKYTASPTGFTVEGRESTFAAGALIGKFGATGRPFWIGDRYRELAAEGGELYLHIVPPPWQNGALGLYSIEFSLEHVE